MKQARIIFQAIMPFDIRLYIQLLINPVSGLIECDAACYSTTSRGPAGHSASSLFSWGDISLGIIKSGISEPGVLAFADGEGFAQHFDEFLHRALAIAVFEGVDAA